MGVTRFLSLICSNSCMMKTLYIHTIIPLTGNGYSEYLTIYSDLQNDIFHITNLHTFVYLSSLCLPITTLSTCHHSLQRIIYFPMPYFPIIPLFTCHHSSHRLKFPCIFTCLHFVYLSSLLCLPVTTLYCASFIFPCLIFALFLCLHLITLYIVLFSHACLPVFILFTCHFSVYLPSLYIALNSHACLPVFT